MNLLKRGLTGAIIVAAISFCIVAGASWSRYLFLLLTMATTEELIRIINHNKGISASRVLAMITAAFFYMTLSSIGTLSDKGAVTAIMAALWLSSTVLLLIREIYGKKSTVVMDIAASMMPMIYIALPMALIPLLGLLGGTMCGTRYNGMLPLSIFIFIWCNDVGAYCVGCSIGRHRLFPRISPKKSWEGSIGGATVTIVAAVLLATVFPEHFGFMSLRMWIAVATTTVVFGTFGDLTESLIKRELGIKDSGSILPGHGGFLDRFDSTLMAVPAVTALLLFIL